MPRTYTRLIEEYDVVSLVYAKVDYFDFPLRLRLIGLWRPVSPVCHGGTGPRRTWHRL